MNGMLAPGWQKRMVVALLWVVIGIVTALLVSGCSSHSGDTSSDRTTTAIAVTWLPQAEVNDVCRKLGVAGSDLLGGCARSRPGDPAVCEVYATEPKNFGDSKALQVLGHEAWHCLGARHAEG